MPPKDFALKCISPSTVRLFVCPFVRLFAHKAKARCREPFFSWAKISHCLSQYIRNNNKVSVSMGLCVCECIFIIWDVLRWLCVGLSSFTLILISFREFIYKIASIAETIDCPNRWRFPLMRMKLEEGQAVYVYAVMQLKEAIIKWRWVADKLLHLRFYFNFSHLRFQQFCIQKNYIIQEIPIISRLYNSRLDI